MTSTRRPAAHVVLGLERLLDERLDLLRDARVGLVCNQATVDHSLRHAADLVHAHPKVRLTTLFGPQHGIRGDVQDNMIETAHGVDRQTGLPVYSLYSETREPTEADARRTSTSSWSTSRTSAAASTRSSTPWRTACARRARWASA